MTTFCWREKTKHVVLGIVVVVLFQVHMVNCLLSPHLVPEWQENNLTLEVLHLKALLLRQFDLLEA